MRTCRPVLGTMVTLLLLAGGCGTERDELEVQIDTGLLRGVRQGETRAFLGVPYAAPPVGAARWRPPREPARWDGVREAFEVGVQCPQSFSLAGPGGEEDCLFVNVWTPAADDAARLPVMVWLHGGAFIFGSGGDDYYNGRFLAETYGVVIVTVNYRLGPLGFLAHPALTAEDPAYPSSGNYGLDDQLAALRWVQRNIARFGGDPARVLLFGESAGGFSTCAHYVSPRSEGLFAYALVQSGLCASTIREPTLAEAEAAGVAAALKLGCPEFGPTAAACLRGKSPDALIAATALPPAADQPPGGPFYIGGNSALLSTLPNVDGFVLKTTLRQAFHAGGFAPRPLVLGTNRDEGTLFHSAFFATAVADEPEYRAALGRRFGAANVDAIVARYPVAMFGGANRALAEVTGDAFFVCPARQAARGAVSVGAPVHLYSFQHEPEAAFLDGLGVFHSVELPFVFGTDPKFPLARVGAGGQAVAGAMQALWTWFATTGSPNGAAGIAWPTYYPFERHLVLDTAPTVADVYKTAECDFWDSVVLP